MINLREKHKPDMSPVLESIFSHAQVSKKNVLVIMLIVRPDALNTDTMHPSVHTHTHTLIPFKTHTLIPLNTHTHTHTHNAHVFIL